MAIIFFIGCPKSTRSQSDIKAVFKLPRSQATSSIGYNVNFQAAMVAILFFVECPKSVASEVLVVLRPYQNVKSIRQAVFMISHSQTISCIGYNVNLRTGVAAILFFLKRPKCIASQVLRPAYVALAIR